MPSTYERLCGTPADPPAPADLTRTAQLIHFAFAGPPEKCEEWIRIAGPHNFRIVRHAGRIVACLVLIPMGQFFGGRSIPMTGVAGVAVAPEARGSGIALDMMRECMREIGGAGPLRAPLSGLYASTQALYRKVGFEQAGHFFTSRLACRSVCTTERRGEIRLLTPADDQAVRDCYARFAAGFPGMLDRGPYIWDRIREFRGSRYDGFGVFGAESGDDSRLEAYVYLSQERKPEGGKHDIQCTDLVFSNATAGRRLLAMLANFATMGDDITFSGAPLHPISTLLPQQTARAALRDYWMTRITDLKGALELRGYPRSIRAEFALDVSDDLVPSNAGLWSVKVTDGRATATRDSDARRPGSSSSGATSSSTPSPASARGTAAHTRLPILKADIRGLAPLYSGLYSPAQAALLGLVEGDEEALAIAATAFAGTTPWMADPF